jgi:hypothetical protein
VLIGVRVLVGVRVACAVTAAGVIAAAVEDEITIGWGTHAQPIINATPAISTQRQPRIITIDLKPIGPTP